LEALLRGPTQWCGDNFEVMHQGIMIEIGDVKIKKARPERVTPRPLQ